MKRWLKTAAVKSLGRCLSGDPSARVVVLCYHSIHPTKCFASATPELFDLHLQWLIQHCELIRFSTVMQARSHKSDRPSVAITFDDGYADNYEYAFPLLHKHGVAASFFTTVGLIERDPAVVDRFQLLRESPYDGVRALKWPQIREMARAGMEFGAHTYSHPNLALISRPAAYRELRLSKDIMEERLGAQISLMAYPFGKPRRHFTTETVNLAAETGYEYAAAVLFRALRPEDSQLAVPRICVARDDVGTLREKLLGLWDVIGIWQERAPLWAAKIFSHKDFVAAPEIRSSLASS